MQSRNFIQYEGNTAERYNNIESTKKWQVVTNPRILAERRRRMVTRKARRLSRILSIVTVGVFVVGLVMQISVMSALNQQSKAQAELYSKIQAQQGQKYIIQTGIANLSAENSIRQRAEELGYSAELADEQIRALNVVILGGSRQVASAQP